MSSSKVPVIALIVPCKNEEPVLPETARTMKSKIDSLVARGMVDSASRIYFIDDGSTDRTWEIICQLAESDPCFEGVKLTRNFGHQFAVYAGLMHAEGDALISIDADLQDRDPPELLKNMRLKIYYFFLVKDHLKLYGYIISMNCHIMHKPH